MIKILSVQDFHFAVEWLDTSKMVGKAVAEAAKKHGVDLIATSDWFDRPILATDKGGLREAQAIMESWQDAAPVVAVEGTPSHDAPGCYGIFDGVEVLRAGVLYGMEKGVGVGREILRPDLILFGVPELNKHTIQAALNLPAEKANAEAVELFGQYVRDFIAPMRLRYAGLPAVGLFHGNVSDSRKENASDIILRSSDIVIHTETLAEADLDYWMLGHIHKPWKSELIAASYPGSWGKTWNETDFVPAMELITIDGETVTVERIPYGTPERRVVTSMVDIVADRNVAYWYKAETAEQKDLFDRMAPEKLHPWSRATIEEKPAESRRVTAEEAATARTLWDLFRLFDPTLPESLKEKVDQIETKAGGQKPSDAMNVSMTYLRVQGCIFFGGRTIELNLAEIPSGMNALVGENGDGKSSIFSFCSPYPLVIGKDTQSGRASAIKDFFSGQDSLIEKRFDVDGVQHTHLITIKGAHTQSPKTEVFISVSGVPQLERATFDEALEWCERTYGPFEDYRITSFYEQPQQASDNRSGLMSAGRTAARNIVQNIAGIDRETEKRYALDQAAALDGWLTREESWIAAAEEFLATASLLPMERGELLSSIESSAPMLTGYREELAEAEKAAQALVIAHEEQKRKAEEARSHQATAHQAGLRISEFEQEIMKLKESAGKVDQLRTSLDAHDKASSKIQSLKEEQQKVAQRNAATEKIYLSARAEYAKKATLEARREAALNAIKALAPCEHCGKLASTAETKRGQYQAEADSLTAQIASMVEPVHIVPEPVPHIEEIRVLSASLLPSLEHTRQTLSEAESAGSRIELLTAEIEHDRDTGKRSDEWLKAFVFDETLAGKTQAAKDSVHAARTALDSATAEQTRREARLEEVEKQIASADTRRAEIETRTATMQTRQSDRDDWSTIARLLNPDKVPALELELVLDQIDSEATRNISPFLDGRFSYRTITQEQGKKSAVDRFDILIHDAETGREFSMFFVNPGNKAFYSDGYVKALISQRNRKMHRTFSPIISDEQDGPISPERVPMYYEIQRAYYGNRREKVLIVTQKKEVASAYIDNQILIKECYR
jgi:hypothetical protein